MMVHEIGSIFSLDRDRQVAAKQGGDNEALCFSLCREALLTIAKRFAHREKKVLLPAYTCQTVIAPFVQEGWQCAFYPVDLDLRIDKAAIVRLAQRLNPSLCVVHPYFGNELNADELEALGKVKDLSCVLVEDRTQILFSENYHEIFDYYVGSYRKWFPIPDGAFLKSGASALSIAASEMSENEKFVHLQTEAMCLRGDFLKNGDEDVKNRSRQMVEQANSVISGKIFPHCMSDFSQKIMNQTDVGLLMQRRTNNYRFLFEHLQCQTVCRLVKQDISELTTAPLFFPIYVQNRAALQAKLCANTIFAPVLWPVQTPEILVNSTIKEIFDTILMIPCDQRYTEDDMQFVVDVINS